MIKVCSHMPRHLNDRQTLRHTLSHRPQPMQSPAFLKYSVNLAWLIQLMVYALCAMSPAYLRYRGKIARYCDFPRKAHGSIRASDTGHRDLSADDGRYLMVSGLKSCMYDKIILLFQAAHARE